MEGQNKKAKEGGKPLYIEMADDIRSGIAEGKYSPGTRIPTEAELETVYGVSRITVRKALELLVNEGAITRRRKVGSFVSEKKMIRYLDKCMSFTQMCQRNGSVAGAKFLSAELVPVWPALARELELGKGEDRVLCVRRLRMCNKVPVTIEENYFSRAYSFLLSEDLEGSLYEILADHGIKTGNSEKVLGICYAGKEEAELLNVSEGDALIQMQDLLYDVDGKPIFSGKEIVEAGRFEYRIHQEA